MVTSQLNRVIQRLRTAMLRVEGAGQTDGQLLESFVHRQVQGRDRLVRPGREDPPGNGQRTRFSEILIGSLELSQVGEPKGKADQ